MRTNLVVLVVSIGAALSTYAAPKLRMSMSAIGPVPIAQGSNGGSQIVTVYNFGDGALNPKVSSSDAWLVATLGPSGPCIQASICFPVTIALQTSTLAAGSYTGFVTVADPNALDAPQTISVTVAIGGEVPSQLTLYAPPGGAATANFETATQAATSASAQSGGNWLSVTGGGFGSFAYTIPYTVTASAANLPAADYSGSVKVSSSGLAADNKTVPVVLHVTSQPIAQPLFPAMSFQIAQGGVKQNYFTAYPFYPMLTNVGLGSLTTSGATTSTASGSNWLTVASDPNNNAFFQITADATGLAHGTYQGTISIASNAANSPTVVPVKLTVVAAGPPIVNFPVANGFTQNGDDGIAPGDFVALFGSQFTTGAPMAAPSLPLGTDLGNGTQVLINGKPVPIQWVSYGQINIQVPYDVPFGGGVVNTLQVVRNGTPGNLMSLPTQNQAPALLPWAGGPYVLAQTLAGGFEGYSPSVPAHVGDVLTFYAVGLGATTPTVTAGTAAPSNPTANITPLPMLCFGPPTPLRPPPCFATSFAGLTPTLFGLYQVNFTVPPGIPRGDAVEMYLQMTNARSNILLITLR